MSKVQWEPKLEELYETKENNAKNKVRLNYNMYYLNN